MNKQLVFGVIAVVFATAFIASLVVGQASARQSILQSCAQDQSSSVVTAGGAAPRSQEEVRSLTSNTDSGSGVTNSGNNEAVCTNTNNGGNAASQ